MKISDWFNKTWFNLVHRHNLVYNTCWEDPRLDRQALGLGPDDTLLVITSAGCNALDYALLGPRHIHAVDMNPRQNALLELKLAGIRRLDFETFFDLFGRGRHPDARWIYRAQLRRELSRPARSYWDRRIDCFSGRAKRGSFYFYGTSGLLAWMVNGYIDRVAKVRDEINAILNAPTIAEQQAIYRDRLHRAFWTRFLRWAMDRDATLSLLGVPRPQRQQVERTYPGGVAKFVEESIEAVFTRLPLHDNYFWRVYLSGQYAPDCCPEYLRRENFDKLKAGLVDRVSVHTSSLLDFIARHPGQISRFVLLDHMDWLSSNHNPVLQRQWQVIVNRAAPGARLLWRSGGLYVDFIDPIEVELAGRRRRLGDLLVYHRDLAAELHARDRVHTYGSFYIADLAKV
jgi:S-adenosylmethionine-diacylglycerol 3-amino-3-carboxypropyl transferase